MMVVDYLNFAESIRPFLQRGKTKCLESVETEDRIGPVSSSLENALDVLHDKYGWIIFQMSKGF